MGEGGLGRRGGHRVAPRGRGQPTFTLCSWGNATILGRRGRGLGRSQACRRAGPGPAGRYARRSIPGVLAAWPAVNKVILVGNLGRDPEARNMQSGGKVVSFSIATSETWNDKASGERKEKTQWHRIAIFNEKLGEIAEKYLKKGSKVYLEGADRDPEIHRQGRPGARDHGDRARPLQGRADAARQPRWRRDGRGRRCGGYGGGRSSGGGYGGGERRAAAVSRAPAAAAAAGTASRRAAPTWTTIFRSEPACRPPGWPRGHKNTRLVALGTTPGCPSGGPACRRRRRDPAGAAGSPQALTMQHPRRHAAGRPGAGRRGRTPA